MFEYYAGWATKISGDIPPVGPQAMSLIVKEPVGVCGLIVPWNYPMLMAAQKVAPALATGCTVVLKPAEQTPLTALRMAAIGRAGRPPCRACSTSSPGSAPRPVSRCSPIPASTRSRFTGSKAIGQHIQRTCADQLKRVTLELGGKSPNIVFADAALDRAVPGHVDGHLRQPGRGVLGRQPGVRAPLDLRRRAAGDDRFRGRRSGSDRASTRRPRWVRSCRPQQRDRVQGYIDSRSR